MTGDQVGWGILGTGSISQRFAQHLTQSPGANLRGVASRGKSNAESFAGKHGGFAYNSYAALCGADDIDIVYVATPTSLHREHCLLALNSGKAVLCEKPFTVDAQMATEVVRVARQQNLFFMEAMWLRFNPRIQELKRELDKGYIGHVQSIRAEVGWAKPDSDDRSREDGGAMLSFGCYALSLAWYLLGSPSGHSSRLLRNSHGLDVNCAVLLHYPETLVTLAATINSDQTNEILVIGSKGNIRVHAPFIDALSMDVHSTHEPRGLASRLQRSASRLRLQMARRYSFLSAPGLAIPGAGLSGEIEECMRCLRLGLKESPLMRHDESLEVHECLDQIRLTNYPEAIIARAARE